MPIVVFSEQGGLVPGAPLIWLAAAVVLITGVYLLGLGLLSAVRPELVKRFLTAFASSARTHYTEQILRMVVGVALIMFAPAMYYPKLVEVFGWIIVITTAGLLLIPWQWHHRFGQWAIPLAIRHLKLFALGSLLLGVLILIGASRALLA